MKKIVSTMLAGVLAATTLLPAGAAVAQNRDRGDWCKFGNCDRDRDNDRRGNRDRDRDDDDGWKFSRNWDNDNDWRWRHRDNDRRYSYRYRDRDRFDGDNAAALVFGLAAGAIAGGIASQGYPGSYERCAATYRSFNPNTWTYLGYDGYYHRCPY